MAENTEISWADDTFNPWMGCTKVSPACDGCYAEALMDTRYGKVKWGAHGERVRTAPSNWAKPLKWEKEQAAKVLAWREGSSFPQVLPIARAPTTPPPPPRFVFCASLADVFDNAVPAEWRRDLFDLIRATPHLTWLLLTKRPGNIVKLFADTLSGINDPAVPLGQSRWPRNAAIGCTVVTQKEADTEIAKLLAAKAALRPAFAFVSMEPLLEAVDIAWALSRSPIEIASGFLRRGHFSPGLETVSRLDWVITGGETDQGSHKARPSSPAWFRAIRDQCGAAGVAYHHKQNGEWGHCADRSAVADHVFRVGKRAAGRMLDLATHDARPEVR